MKTVKITQTVELDEFTLAYIECALWSTNDNSNEQGGEPLDKNYSMEDIDPQTLTEMMADCKEFQKNYYKMIEDDLKRAGHDFWLTRNGHGAGFWDGDWPEHIGEFLTWASKQQGEVDLYVGDDHKIYM